MAKFKNEAELAALVSAYLTEGGWTCYHEVTRGGGFPRADIVAVLGPRLWVVECKLSLSLALLAQAKQWQGYAHRVSIAVPSSRTTSNAKAFGLTVARQFGIGVMVCGSYDSVNESVQPTMLRRPPLVRHLRDMLHEDQRSTAPGTQGGDYSTAFKRTCRSVLDHVRRNGGSMPVRDALKTVDHHYASYSSARSSLITMAEAGKANGLLMYRVGRVPMFETAKHRAEREKDVAPVTAP